MNDESDVWGAYLGVQIGSLLHERPDSEPETIGEREVVLDYHEGAEVGRIGVVFLVRVVLVMVMVDELVVVLVGMVGEEGMVVGV